MRRSASSALVAVIVGVFTLGAMADDLAPVSFDDWHTPDEVTEILSAFDACRDVATLYQFGETYEERPLLALRISDATVPDPKPDLVFVGMHHAREWIAVEMVLFLIEHFVDTLSATAPSDPELREALRHVDVWMIPVLNPDGYRYSYDGRHVEATRMWRKNRAPTGIDGVLGTDLNRNYPHYWGLGGPRKHPVTGGTFYPSGSPYADDETYAGGRAESEAEVVALIELLTDKSGDGGPIDDPRVMMSYHSYGAKIVGPWAYDAEASSIKVIGGGPILEYTVEKSAKVANAAVTDPTLADPYDTDFAYTVFGDAADYFWASHRIASFTTELPPEGSLGLTGFEADAATVAAAHAENRGVACDLVKDVGLTKVWIRDYEGDDGSEPSSVVGPMGAWEPPFWTSPDIDVTDASVRKVRVRVQNSTAADMTCDLRLYKSSVSHLEFPELYTDAIDTMEVVVPPSGGTFDFDWPAAWSTPPSFIAAAVFHEGDRPLSNQVPMTSNMACRSVIEIELEPGTDRELELFAVNPTDGEAALEVVTNAPLTVRVGRGGPEDDARFAPQLHGELVHAARLLTSPREDLERSRASIRLRVGLEAGRQTPKEIPVSIVLRPLTEQRFVTSRRLVSGVTIIVRPR